MQDLCFLEMPRIGAGDSTVTMSPMNKTPIALQLFAVRNEVARDLPNTLKMLARIGYDGAEPWGYDGKTMVWQNHPVADVRRMYDDQGLKCCGIHLATDALLGDNLKRTIEFNQILGNRFLIIAADKRTTTREGLVELADILNSVAAKLKPLGMYTGYHAHGFDFGMVDGKVAWDTLFSTTNPEVIMQMDTGNCAGGGGDPIAMLRKFPGRARSMHLKEFGGATKEAVIGEGKLDWATIVELCQSLHRPEWYVIEEGTGDGFDIPRRSREAVRALRV